MPSSRDRCWIDSRPLRGDKYLCDLSGVRLQLFNRADGVGHVLGKDVRVNEPPFLGAIGD